jgi:nucleoside-diphosphate-sugar epimerase
MIAERVLFSYQDKIKIFIIRPATVCGLSLRMRFDISVNLLTLQALKYGVISLNGGKQIRPNINLKDMIRVYEHFIKEDIVPGIYNAGFENISLKDLSKKISTIIPCKIKIKKVNDPRSYRINSTKLLRTGFVPKYSVADAINEIKNTYDNNQLKENISNYNVKLMKRIKVI